MSEASERSSFVAAMIVMILAVAPNISAMATMLAAAGDSLFRTLTKQDSVDTRVS